jgi:hypothetical protein
LPPRGTKDRDRVLRIYDAHDYNNLWQGARSGITKKVASLPFVLNGPTAKVQYWQDMLGQAHFGRGWEYLLKLIVRDFLTQSYGGIFEIAGPGDPTKPLLETPTGINHLDAGRCYVTGNPIYPILYYSLWDGRLHRMHASRVYQLADDPIADERYFGIGTSALERSIAICNREIRMAEYIDAQLDDKPQPGMLALTGMTSKQWENLLQKYMGDQQKGDNIPAFGRTIVLTSLDPNAPVKAESIPFSQTPELFDFAKYTDVDIDSFALAIGVDRQELWQLSGGKAIGTASQSETLNLKSRGKLYGDLITSLERFVNWALLPDDCEFKIEEQDTQEDARQAALDLQIVQVGQALIDMGFETEVVAQLLTQQSKTFRDAFENDLGQVQATSGTEQVTPQVSQDANLESDTPAPTDAQTTPRVVAQTAKDVTAYKFNPNHESDTGRFAHGSGGGGGGSRAGVGSTRPSREAPNDTKPVSGKKPFAREEWQKRTRITGDASQIAKTTGLSADDLIRISGGGEIPLEKYPKARSSIAPQYDSQGRLRSITVSIQDKAPSEDDLTNYDGISIQRTLHFDENGNPDYIVNDHFYLGKNQTGTGFGTQVFSSQVSEASRKGFKSIRTLAGKSKYMNGYYTWPRLGYDAQIPITVDKIPPSVLKKNPRLQKPLEGFLGKLNPKGRMAYLSELMSTPEGRDYWKSAGYAKEMEFDLKPRSRSRKVLNAYLKERFGQGASKRLKAMTEDSELRLSDEEERILDSVWDTIEFDDEATKAFTTSSGVDFTTRFADILTRTTSGALKRNQAENLMLGLLLNTAKRVYRDGLAEGGVTEDLDAEENQEIQNWVADQIEYLDPLLALAERGGLTPAQIDARAQMWASKGLTQVQTMGRMSADANGMYEFVGDDGKENCKTCRRLKGQIHRLKDWKRKKMIPGRDTNAFICKGFQCRHTLQRTMEAAKGSW